ncbi:MAG: hypothetical protein WBA93_20190 [Microcoleaceae cyanobacterium]
MSFDCFEYLTLAQQLAGKTLLSASEESRLRSAISRGYYAAFILARNYLRDYEEIIIPVRQTHQFVITQFKYSPDLVKQGIGKDLSRLRFNRNQADYDDRIDNLPAITTRVLKLAEKVIFDLERLASPSKAPFNRSES